MIDIALMVIMMTIMLMLRTHYLFTNTDEQEPIPILGSICTAVPSY